MAYFDCLCRLVFTDDGRDFSANLTVSGALENGDLLRVCVSVECWMIRCCSMVLRHWMFFSLLGNSLRLSSVDAYSAVGQRQGSDKLTLG